MGVIGLEIDEDIGGDRERERDWVLWFRERGRYKKGYWGLRV